MPHGDKVGRVDKDTELDAPDIAEHITGLPKVTQSLPLRGVPKDKSLGPLYDQDTVLGGLVDI